LETNSRITTINHEPNKKPSSRKTRNFEYYAGFVFMNMLAKTVTSVWWDCKLNLNALQAVNTAQYHPNEILRTASS